MGAFQVESNRVASRRIETLGLSRGGLSLNVAQVMLGLLKGGWWSGVARYGHVTPNYLAHERRNLQFTDGIDVENVSIHGKLCFDCATTQISLNLYSTLGHRLPVIWVK